MVLTVFFALSPVTGLVCHRRQRSRLRQLDASVGASGPHDFAVRESGVRLRHCHDHRIPPPTSVTIAKRPSEEAGPNRNIPVSTCPSNEIRKIRSRNPWDGAQLRLSLRRKPSGWRLPEQLPPARISCYVCPHEQ